MMRGDDARPSPKDRGCGAKDYGGDVPHIGREAPAVRRPQQGESTTYKTKPPSRPKGAVGAEVEWPTSRRRSVPAKPGMEPAGIEPAQAKP